MHRRTRSRTLGRLGTLAVLPPLVLPPLMLVGGCGGDPGASDSAASDPGTPTSTSGSETRRSSPGETPSETPGDSPGETPSESPSADPSVAGDLVTGDGFGFVPPQGWKDQTGRFQKLSPEIDLGYLDSGPQPDRYADNINVIRNEDYPEVSLDRAEKQFAEEARTVSQHVKTLDPVTIDEVTSVHQSGITAAAGLQVRTTQFASYVDGAWYVITFSYDGDTSRAQEQREIQRTLASWQWEASAA